MNVQGELRMNWRRRGLWLGFALYCAGMVWLLFLRRTPGTAAVNLVPLRTVREFWSGLWAAETRKTAVIQLVGNVGTFLPLGWFLPRLWRRAERFGWCLMAVTALVALVEFGQLILTLGCCDVDDLMLNDLGAALGFFLWRSGGKRTEPRENEAY